VSFVGLLFFESCVHRLQFIHAKLLLRQRVPLLIFLQQPAGPLLLPDHRRDDLTV
jgi:hypothetical protein